MKHFTGQQERGSLIVVKPESNNCLVYWNYIQYFADLYDVSTESIDSIIRFSFLALTRQQKWTPDSLACRFI